MNDPLIDGGKFIPLTSDNKFFPKLEVYTGIFTLSETSTYDFSTTIEANLFANVMNNPLYQSSGNSGTNPLFNF